MLDSESWANVPMRFELLQIARLIDSYVHGRYDQWHELSQEPTIFLLVSYKSSATARQQTRVRGENAETKHNEKCLLFFFQLFRSHSKWTRGWSQRISITAEKIDAIRRIVPEFENATLHRSAISHSEIDASIPQRLYGSIYYLVSNIYFLNNDLHASAFILSGRLRILVFTEKFEINWNVGYD